MKKHVFAAMIAIAFAAPAFAEDAAPAAVELAALDAGAAAQEVASVVPERRELMLSADGARVGNVRSLNADGSPNVIFNQRFLAIPLNTLSRTDGRLVTSLTHRELMRLE